MSHASSECTGCSTTGLDGRGRDERALPDLPAEAEHDVAAEGLRVGEAVEHLLPVACGPDPPAVAQERPGLQLVVAAGAQPVPRVAVHHGVPGGAGEAVRERAGDRDRPEGAETVGADPGQRIGMIRDPPPDRGEVDLDLLRASRVDHHGALVDQGGEPAVKTLGPQDSVVGKRLGSTALGVGRARLPTDGLGIRSRCGGRGRRGAPAH